VPVNPGPGFSTGDAVNLDEGLPFEISPSEIGMPCVGSSGKGGDFGKMNSVIGSFL
jgi:hypothetical protein